MTKFLAAIMIGCLAFVPAASAGGLLSGFATYDWETREPDAKFKLRAHGFDLRVYEWTPKTDPTMRCTVMFGESGPSGMECWKKDSNRE